MPGAGRTLGTIDGGPLKGGAPRVVWQTLGADPRTVSAGAAAKNLDQLGRACHLVWNPLQGETVQLIPIVRAGRLLGWPERRTQAAPPSVADARGTAASGTAAEAAAAGETVSDETVSGGSESGGSESGGSESGSRAPGTAPDRIAEANAEGRLCVQICVVAFAWDPFTSLPMSGLQQILDWLESWRIPRKWLAGPPAPHPRAPQACADRRLWSRGGHFGASQVPGLTAAGPGAVDVEQLTGRSVPAGRPAAGAAPARVPDLDGYFGRDEATAAGALSRVG
jgi:hypothetical protein